MLALVISPMYPSRPASAVSSKPTRSTSYSDADHAPTRAAEPTRSTVEITEPGVCVRRVVLAIPTILPAGRRSGSGDHPPDTSAPAPSPDHTLSAPRAVVRQLLQGPGVSVGVVEGHEAAPVQLVDAVRLDIHRAQVGERLVGIRYDGPGSCSAAPVRGHCPARPRTRSSMPIPGGHLHEPQVVTDPVIVVQVKTDPLV